MEGGEGLAAAHADAVTWSGEASGSTYYSLRLLFLTDYSNFDYYARQIIISPELFEIHYSVLKVWLDSDHSRGCLV